MAKKQRNTTIELTENPQSRARIEHVYPEIEGGRYAVKRTTGEYFNVEADITCDGHDRVSAWLMIRRTNEVEWHAIPMNPLGNDRYEASMACKEIGEYEYTLKAIADHHLTWLTDLEKRIGVSSDEDIKLQLLIGVQFLKAIRNNAQKSSYKKIDALIKKLDPGSHYKQALKTARSKALQEILTAFPADSNATWYSKLLPLRIEREKARFSAWYSIFPRSTSTEGKHGTFKDCIKQLPRIQKLGFDVLYLTPVHPIGTQYRKGKNNNTSSLPGEPGCPYAIGDANGGHTAILKELGTLADFKALIKEAKARGIEVAMDYALQASPDHPWVKEHKEWFVVRPDGSIQYAENPPKKYQDVYPMNFEHADWQAMWNEFKDIIEYWISVGIRIFRVDNPHTKSFIFWEWLIKEINKTYPDVLFLSEAFTRPKIMQHLARAGFQQSYTYYTWRNTKQEIQEYLTELTTTEQREYMRPNFWPNTHDILPFSLQTGHEPQYIIRYFMAATLSSNYGIFSPAFEFMAFAAMPGKEEYLNSEKYEVGHWDWSTENKLTYVIEKVNKARKENEALQFTNNITFIENNNENILAFFKEWNGNKIIGVVNLDAYNTQSATLYLPHAWIGKNHYVVHDLMNGDRWHWHGDHPWVELNPFNLPVHLFVVED